MSSFFPFDDARTLLINANLVPIANLHIVNEPFQQPQTSNWLSFEAYSNFIKPADLGAKLYQERGQIMVYCIAPFGTGTDSLRVLAKNVANTFRGLPARNPFYNDASIGVGTPSEGGDAYVIPVSIAFTYQDISV